MEKQLLENYPQGIGCVCPVCGTSNNEVTILVPIHEKTFEYGLEAIPVHVECILQNIEYSKKHKLMGMEALQ